MADRTVVVRYRADAGDLVTVSRAAGGAVQTAFTGAQSSTEALHQSTRNLGIGLLGVGAAATIGVGSAISTFSGFSTQMSAVEAATHASAAGMGVLSDATLDAAQASKFGAVEAGQGVEALGKAGLATADILGGGLKGSLDLAAAGGLAVADSAQTMATALSVFNLEGGQASHVADLLAAGAGKAQGSVSDMSAALNQSALVAHQVGLSVEDTTGVLAEFANAGLLGSDAGTSFRTMLLRLINPSVEAKTVMDDLGISVYDAQGNFAGMESIAQQLQDRMGGLDASTRDAALATIFGSDAIRGATVLYQDGAAGVEQWRNSVDDAGYAAETARIMTDNLAGDVERMGGAWETAMIKIGAGSEGPLRGATQLLTDVITVVSDAPPVVHEMILVLGGLTAAVALSGGAALLAAPKIVAYRTALNSLRTATDATSGTRALAGVLGGLGRALPIVGTALALGSVALGIFAKGSADAAQADSDFRSSLDQTTGALTDQTRAVVALDLQTQGLLDLAQQIGLSEGTIVSAVLGDPAAIREVETAVNAVKDAYRAAYVPGSGGVVTTEMRSQLAAAQELSGEIPVLGGHYQDLKDDQLQLLEAQRAQAGTGTVVTTSLEGIAAASRAVSTAYGEVGPAAEDAAGAQEDAASGSVDIIDGETDAVLGLIDAYNDLYDINKSAPEALGAYHESLRDTAELVGELTDAVDENGDSIDTSGMSIGEIVSKYGQLSGVLNSAATDFDVTTEAGYSLRQSFDDIGRSAEESALRTLEYNRGLADGDPTKLAAANRTYVETLEASRASMSLSLQALGLTKEAADALALSIIGIPDAASTEVTMEDEELSRKEKQHKQRLDDLERARHAKLDADASELDPVVIAAEEKLTAFEERRTAQLFADDDDVTAAVGRQGTALDRFEAARTVKLFGDDTAVDQVVDDQDAKLDKFELDRHVDLFANDEHADQVVQAQEQRLAAFERDHTATLHVDDGDSAATLTTQEEALTSFERRRVVQLFGDDTAADATEDDQETRLGEFEADRTVDLFADESESDAAISRQMAALDRFEAARTVKLFGDPAQADATEDDQEARLGEFVQPRTVPLRADDTHADSVEDDQAARQREFERLKTVQLAGNDSHADAVENDQAARQREFERTKTVPLDADPSGAISGVAAAQRAINGLHGKTVFVDVDFLIGKLPEGIEKAEGGYVPARQGGTHTILGEGGEGEWVVPESKVDDFIARMVERYGVGRMLEGQPDSSDGTRLDRDLASMGGPVEAPAPAVTEALPMGPEPTTIPLPAAPEDRAVRLQTVEAASVADVAETASTADTAEVAQIAAVAAVAAIAETAEIASIAETAAVAAVAEAAPQPEPPQMRLPDAPQPGITDLLGEIQRLNTRSDSGPDLTSLINELSRVGAGGATAASNPDVVRAAWQPASMPIMTQPAAASPSIDQRQYILQIPPMTSKTPIDVLHREWRTYADVGRGS